MGLLDSLKLPDDLKNLTHEELNAVADETRKLIIDVCSRHGGHLAPSLGVVELAISLLRTFDPLYDRVVWDVGHQSYAWKILTDRKDRFPTLRQHGGISGFIKPTESPFDAFAVGHTSTSISAALGMACADDILERERKIVAVIGDGAMTAGMAFEALNSLGHLKKNMIVILNDNEMSISKNVGAFSGHLSRIMTGELYTRFRKDVQSMLEHAPFGNRLLSVAKKMEEGVIGMFTPGILFEELGLRYIGPVNGHKTKEIENALKNAMRQSGPVIIHVSTTKGKGYEPAEIDPARFHGVGSFDVNTGKSVKIAGESWTGVFSKTIMELAEKDERIVGITAAMMDGTGLGPFAEKYPERFFDVGIAEQHAVTFAAGLAISGMRPFVALYSTFLQRAFDQVIHDVALQNLPVTICIDRAGLVGADGPTHHGAFDLSFLRMVPNLTVMIPRSGRELAAMLYQSLSIDGPVAIRYPRGSVPADDPELTPVELGKPEVTAEGGDVAIVSAGHIYSEAEKLHLLLMDAGIEATLVNLRYLKPLDEDALMDAIGGKKVVVTVEENSLKGGVNEEILSILARRGESPAFLPFGLPDRFVSHGNLESLRKECGMAPDAMLQAVLKKL